MIEELKNEVIVSVQAMPDEPLYKEECMLAMMKSVINGGAKALRVAGSRDVKNAKTLGVRVIGLTKPEKLPDNWKEVVYITPTKEKVDELIEADADIIALTEHQDPDLITVPSKNLLTESTLQASMQWLILRL
jgi:N-acylglucosamine-6-phosphate 2-epimerase